MSAAGFPVSRWDGLMATSSPFQHQYDAGNILRVNTVGNGRNLIRTTLVDQKINTVDPSFYDCFYGIANSQSRIVEQCYKDIGCCQFGCCSNEDWHIKYGWAVALIVIFCIVVVISFVIWLIVWLINRSKDKRQKRIMYERSVFSSPSPLDISFAESPPPVEKYGFETKHANGYRY